MLNLKINYSIKNEIERIENTIREIEWFKENGYKPRFPENFSFDIFSQEKIGYLEKVVSCEYVGEDYKKVEDFILEKLPKISSKLESLPVSIKLQNTYEINLTKYGVGGSYHLPNKIIVNIKGSYDIGLVRVIIHEIVHLSIQKWIEEYNVEHWKKERVVDLIFEKIAPEINKIQNIPIDTKLIDEVFKNNYPDLETILKQIA